MMHGTEIIVFIIRNLGALYDCTRKVPVCRPLHAVLLKMSYNYSLLTEIYSMRLFLEASFQIQYLKKVRERTNQCTR